MIGRTLSHFRILAKIGEGGMGVVYRAEDTNLRRQVALKVLPPELVANEERRLRFLREARAAAAVTHPNIGTIYEVDEAGGIVFIAMELVEGKTLREAIGGRPMPIKDALRIATEMAEGLARAHQAKVIHRDLKPDNVIVGSDGHAKILDFGLAKLLEERSGSTDAAASKIATISGEMTREGKIFGTAAYMSPEQARGQQVDTRSDIFSFGTTLYEMVTGRVPFQGKTNTDILSAIIRDEPVPPSQQNAEIPPKLEEIIQQCLEKDPQDRYLHTDQLAADLRKAKRVTDSGVQAVRTPSGPVAATPSRIGERLIGGRGRRRALVAVLAVLAGALLAYRYFAPKLVPSSPESLAVMYFENLADPADTDNLATMLTSLLTTELSGTEGLQVMSSQRLYDIAKQIGAAEGPLDRSVASEVARRAGVATMVLGQVARAGDRMVATTELVDVTSGLSLASQRAEGRRAEDIFAIAEALGGQVRQTMRRSASARDTSDDLIRQLTGSVDAYRAYVRGEALYQRLDVTGAAEQFREAVRIDPDFALAHYRLSRVDEWLGNEDEMRHAADRSLALIDKLPMSYRDIVKASALYFQGTHSVAIPLLETVLAREPENKEALYVLSEIYVHSARDNDLSRVTSLLEQILNLDPDFHLAYHHLAFAYIFQGEIGKANVLLDRWEAEEPEVVREARSWIAALEGRYDEALRLVEGLAAPYVAVWRVRHAILMSRWDLAREFTSLDQSEGYVRTQVLRLQGVLHVYQGHFDQAVAAYREAGAAMGSRRDEGVVGGSAASALQSLSELLVLKGNREAAQAEAERALAIQPESPRCLYFAGLFALRNGNFPAAGRYLEKVKQLMSVVRSTSAHSYRDSLEAEIALMQGRPHEAKLLFEKVVDSRKFLLDQGATLTSAESTVRDGLARTYLALGEKEKAAEALEALLASGWERADQPELYVRAMYRLGMLRLDAGDTVGGSEFLRKFLDHWGEADWNLLEVTEAKARLAALGEVEAAGVIREALTARNLDKGDER